jgi:Sigma-54 interaction domain
LCPKIRRSDKNVQSTFAKSSKKLRFVGRGLASSGSTRFSFWRFHVAIAGSDSNASDTLHAQVAVTLPPVRRPVPPPTRLAIQAGDWNTFVGSRANAIVVGTEEAALGVWTAVWPSLQKPIHWVEAERLSLPRRSAGTLILQGADDLSACDQQQLLEWLEGDARATRILTTTRRPLFPLVESGQFLEALYYRLNVILLVLEARGSSTPT